MKAIQISKARFDALCVVRRVGTENWAPEAEWWSTDDGTLIGTVSHDLTDDDWTWIVLGRDQNGLFRRIDIGCSIPTQQTASELLQSALLRHGRDGKTVFPQEGVDEPNTCFNLLTPFVDEGRLFPHFKTLISTPEFSAAAALIKEFSPMFIDVDGNFIEQFQTTAFNSRLWELYLDRMLREQGFTRITEFDRPDYCVMKGGVPIGIEAVTVNPSEKHVMPSTDSPDEARKVLEDFMPLRFSGPLNAKLGKRYWELPHMAGVPLVIAIQDFFTEQSMTWSLGALRRYLYGMHAEGVVHPDGTIDAKYQEVKTHVWGDKSLASGFFNLPGSEYVSAVMANTSATLSKFNRIGKEAGLGDPSVSMVRLGTEWDPDPKAATPLVFKYEVTPDVPRERWSDGLAIFVNPNAKNPLPLGLFEAGEIHKMEAGRLAPYLRQGHIYASQTFISKPE